MGGVNSTLILENFKFMRQRDARFLISDISGKQVISFLNNASDDHHNSSTTSSAYFVEVDEEQRVARLVRELPRPDGKLGKYRGNVQSMSNGNTLVHRGDNGYMTEFDSHGIVLQEAHFIQPRIGTYRAYNYPFVAMPSEPIAMRCVSHAVPDGLNATVC